MALVAALVANACGDDSGATTSVASSGAAGGMDDGLFHPQPDGVMIAEAAACKVLQSAVKARAAKLHCAKTVYTCPNFLRVQYDPDCVLYDEGTVIACKKFYDAVSSCETLVEQDCVLVVYPGTEPQGCP